MQVSLDSAKYKLVEEHLARLKDEFRKNLDERILKIETCWIAAKDPELAENALAVVIHEVHRLAGTAASFGFHAIGEEAAHLDARLQSALQQSFSWSMFEEFDSKIEYLLDLLEAELP